MRTTGIWRRVRERIGGSAGRFASVAIQPLGLNERECEAMREVLDQIGERLSLRFELRRDEGEMMLLDSEFAARSLPEMLRSAVNDRPVILIEPFNGDLRKWYGAIELFGRRQRDLQRQLMDLTLVRRRSPHWSAAGWLPEIEGAGAAPFAASAAPSSAFDSNFDSMSGGLNVIPDNLDETRRELVQRVLAGLHDTTRPPLSASYGPLSNMLFDFRTGLVAVDPLAQQFLRVRREIPLAAPGAQTQTEAIVRELDETVWDLGLASADLPLLDAPRDWWHAPLTWSGKGAAERYTRMPQHLELARCIAAGPITPSELRRQARVGVGDLRRFLQACLFLDLVVWTGAPQ